MKDLQTLKKVQEAYLLMQKAQKVLASIQVDFTLEMDEMAKEDKDQFMKEQEGLAQDFS